MSGVLRSGRRELTVRTPGCWGAGATNLDGYAAGSVEAVCTACVYCALHRYAAAANPAPVVLPGWEPGVSYVLQPQCTGGSVGVGVRGRGRGWCSGWRWGSGRGCGGGDRARAECCGDGCSGGGEHAGSEGAGIQHGDAESEVSRAAWTRRGFGGGSSNGIVIAGASWGRGLEGVGVWVLRREGWGERRGIWGDGGERMGEVCMVGREMKGCN